jgi:hypothetical protein
MRRHAITITAASLGFIGLAATGVFLFYITDLAPIQALLLAFVALLGAFYALLALLLVTNTRRPAGIDPNEPRAVDPFGQTTDELRGAVFLPDKRPYGRRSEDDMAVVKRLIGKLEEQDLSRPPPMATPAWALDLQQEHADSPSEEER